MGAQLGCGAIHGGAFARFGDGARAALVRALGERSVARRGARVALALTASRAPAFVTEAFVWNRSGLILVLLADGDYTTYVYDPIGLPLKQVLTPPGEALFYLHDQQGSTRFITIGSGLVHGYSYDPYGNVQDQVGELRIKPFQYDGQYTDAE